MKPLKPTGRVDLKHSARRLRGTPQGSTIVAAAVSGQVSLINLVKNEIQVHRQSGKIIATSLHPTAPLFAIVSSISGSLSIRNFDGTKIAQMQSPHSKASSARGFADCFFDDGGDVLWLAAPVSDHECRVLLVETKRWSVICSTIVEDHFGQSFFWFHSTGRPGLVSLWVAAGQDGQEVYWLKREGFEFTCNQVEKLTNCTPPTFSPLGSELLVLTEDSAIRRHEFPSMTQLGSPCLSGADDDPFAGPICYVDSQHVLAGTGEERIFLIDTAKMRIEDEIAIEGHEPRPIGEYFPALAHEGGLATDISGFVRLSDVIVFVFHRDRGTGLKVWQDSLMWYSVKK